MDVYHQVCGCNGRVKWTLSDISAVCRDLHEVKLNGECVLRPSGKSVIKTVKWHMIDHVVDNIVRNGGLYLCEPGLYEYAPKILKQSYSK